MLLQCLQDLVLTFTLHPEQQAWAHLLLSGSGYLQHTKLSGLHFLLPPPAAL